MGESLNTFEKHIPEKILEENVPLKKLLLVLDGMLKIRKDELFNYTRSFLYPLVSDIKTMRRYVDEWGAEYTEYSSKFCIDCLYRRYFEIYSRKGTKLGLEKLLTCLLWVDSEPTIKIDSYFMGKPLILFDNIRPYDWLPTDVEIAGELLASTGEEIWCPTLLDDTWVYQKVIMDITINVGYTPSSEFITFLKAVIILYLPMANEDFTIINLNIT